MDGPYLRRILVDIPAAWRPVAALEPLRLQLPDQVARVVQRFAHLVPRMPAPYELEHTYNELLRAWTENRWSGLPLRTLRRSPHVLFWTGGSSVLGGDPTFLRAYFRVLRQRAMRGPTARALLHVYLREYPRHQKTFRLFRELLSDFFLDTPSVLLERWKSIVRHYDLFSDQAPQNVARDWWRQSSPARLMEQSGFTGELASGQFMRHVFYEVCRLMYDRLASRSATHGELSWFYDFATVPDSIGRRRLRFGGENGAFADTLLLPFAEEAPPADLQQQITRMLLDTLSDPRIVPWSGVSDNTIAIFRRWLIGNTLEDFFRIIDKTADPGPWPYRRQFWLAYHKRRYIDDACIALGTNARRLAQSASLNLKLDFYSRLDQARGDQSVLILRIRQLTIVEWSHSGACRIWIDNSRAPKLHQRRYTRSEFMQPPDDAVRHVNSEAYRWQQALATKIYHYTGIQIPWSEFRLR